MVKKVGILVGPLFEDLEFWSIYMRLKEEGYDVPIIGTKVNETYKSKSGGLTATSTIASSEINHQDLLGLTIPGGFAPDSMRRDKFMLQLIRDLHTQKKVIGFICHAGWMAASAKIIQGRPCIGSLGIKDDLENAGGIWVDKPAFIDGHLVWGRVVEDIPQYQKLLIQALNNC